MASAVIKKLRRLLPLAGTSGRKPDTSSGTQDNVTGTGNGQIAVAPEGHFYSPIPDHNEVRRNEERIFRIPKSLSGIELNIDEQLLTLNSLASFGAEMPFQAEKTKGLRYCLKNSMFGFADGISLYGLIRHLKPKRIIEVGAGYSSCVMLDTNERFFENRISCTFIEPNPAAFLSLIKPGDLDRIQLVRTPLQEVDPNTFRNLSANDILFIDSSHVSKAGSDVNYLIFEVLPELQSGVYVHFHDIFYPFEYPKHWICDLGISWNEAYLLRAFLQYNQSFRIALFINYLERFHLDQLRALMPQSAGGAGGSLWLRKV
ncbi:MAG TPA: class I SAM-dependent methyltransferase [Pyrinomonadaceae bacterium]|nr:class I SAM-dependent methyltransferase [Pyrinomonadaceae bacterium]